MQEVSFVIMPNLVKMRVRQTLYLGLGLASGNLVGQLIWGRARSLDQNVILFLFTIAAAFLGALLAYGALGVLNAKRDRAQMKIEVTATAITGPYWEGFRLRRVTIERYLIGASCYRRQSWWDRLVGQRLLTSTDGRAITVWGGGYDGRELRRISDWACHHGE